MISDVAAGSRLIEVDTVSKFYSQAGRQFRALENVSFDVAEGEFLSIVGPSGCGKSTLLSIIAGLTEGTAGAVRIAGQRMEGPNPGTVAVVFQDPLLLPWRSALSNVELPLEIRGVSAPERTARAQKMIELVGLRDFAANFPGELSGGMRQRIAIARGLVQEPRIVLMDEPFGALDEQTRTRMGDELLRIWQATKKTVLFVTHSLTEALYLSDRVLVMGRNPGRIVDVIPVPMPRPRNIDMIGSKEFGEARNRIWHLIGADAEPALETQRG